MTNTMFNIMAMQNIRLMSIDGVAPRVASLVWQQTLRERARLRMIYDVIYHAGIGALA